MRAAIERIHTRHADADDPRREHLPADPSGGSTCDLAADASEALDYVLAHLEALPPAWRRDELRDALILRVGLYWRDLEREHRLLTALERARGASWRDAAVLNITTRQSFVNRLDGLDRALARWRGRPEADPRLDAVQERWLAAHRERVRALAAGLAAVRDDPSRDRPVEAVEWLEYLAEDLEGELTPASVAMIGLAVAELRPVLDRGVLAEWAELSAEWETLG